MKIRSALLLGLTCTIPAAAGAAAPALAQGSAQASGSAHATLPRSAPESQGIASSAILAFVEAAEKEGLSLHSLMLLRHGQVVAEGWWKPYRAEEPHVLWSLTKSFASTGIGLAIAEGRLSLDDTLVSHFPDDVPADASENLKTMRVRDLLSMSTGHHAEAIQDFPYADAKRSAARAFLALPVAHKPGTHFVYNTPASHMLSALVQKVSGTTLAEYLRPRLFEPLGIANAPWEAAPQGMTMGGFGLSLKTEDIARFAQLYAQGGVWNGRRLLPAEWVAAATARQVSNGSSPASDWEQGYGFQFWRCRHGLYRGDGAFGQFAIVMPEQDAVVALTSGSGNMQGIMNLVWQHLLAGMQTQPLPADEAGQRRLSAKLAALSLPPAAGAATSPRARSVSGRIYELPATESGIQAVGLEQGRQTTLVFRVGGRESRLPAGSGEWLPGTIAPGGVEQPVATSGAWTSDDTFVARTCQIRTAFCTTFKLQFGGDLVIFDQEQNVGFGPTKRPQLVGRANAAGR